MAKCHQLVQLGVFSLTMPDSIRYHDEISCRGQLPDLSKMYLFGGAESMVEEDGSFPYGCLQGLRMANERRNPSQQKGIICPNSG